MEKTQILSIINNALDRVDVQNQITIARQEGFNQGYKTCLEEFKRLFEEEINAEQSNAVEAKEVKKSKKA